MATTLKPDRVRPGLGPEVGSTPELTALIACGRVGVSDDLLAAVFREVTDWRTLQVLAERHGLLPLLCASVDRCGPTIVPAQELAHLRRMNKAVFSRAMRLTVVLVKILGLFDDAGVRALGYKGPLLAQYAYGEFAARIYQDLDVFVSRSDLDRACSILQSGGFVHEPKPAALRAQEYHHVLHRQGVRIELHWRPGPAYVPPMLPAEELLSRARPTTLLGRPCLTLDPSDLLLTLAAHGHAHHWSELEQVVTFARVLSRREYDEPAALLSRARERYCLRRLHVACLLAADLTGVAVPKELRASARGNDCATHLAGHMSRALRRSDRGRYNRWATTAWRAAAMDRPGDSLRLAALQVFAPRDDDVVGAGTSRTTWAQPMLRRLSYLKKSMHER